MPHSHAKAFQNGPSFNGAEFESYAKHCGFIHRKTTPHWPQANWEAERFMRTLQKCIRAVIIEKSNWKQAMTHFLLNYRATPHSTTHTSPSESLNNRRCILPQNLNRKQWLNMMVGRKNKIDEILRWQQPRCQGKLHQTRWYCPF